MKIDKPFVTDNGNYIYDCHFPGGIPDADRFQNSVCGHAGVIETGLFLQLARIALIADDSGKVETLRRK